EKIGVTEKEIAQAQKAVLQGVYLRVTIGGGFFSISEPENPMVVADEEDAYVKPTKKDKKATTEQSSETAPLDDAKPRKEKRTRKAQPADSE
ncbi:MAG: hypothetical protein NZ534_09095, partial [Bacteroidia bacterium]|nr:hypothetical protein [Bacteroidia bacterium]